MERRESPSLYDLFVITERVLWLFELGQIVATSMCCLFIYISVVRWAHTPSLGQTVIHSLCNWKQKWPSNANRIYHIFSHWAQNSVFLEPINFKVLLITLRFVIVYESKRKQLPTFNVCAAFFLNILFRFLVCFSCCDCITSAKWNDGKT